jgi:hypothetical protein
MNASWIEPPPAQSGMGCFAKGCLILVAFFVLLGLAFVGGTFFAVRHLKTSYFPTARVDLPPPAATQEEQELARAHWSTFETAARAHAPAHIEMTADELNALIASNPKLRGKAFVSIENKVARVQLSIPLDDVRWLRGHYVNAECMVQPGESGKPEDAHITHIVLNGKPVDDEALNWRGPWSLRRYLENWTEKSDLKTFEIQDGRVILETRGQD